MSRENILQSLRTNKPQSSVKLPDIPGYLDETTDLLFTFINNLKGNKIIVHQDTDVSEILKKSFPDVRTIYSGVASIPGNIKIKDKEDPHRLADIEVAILQAELGVADNGSIWISDKSLIQRVLPFIVEHLIVVVNKENIVSKMHQAYDGINPEDFGYGVFVAGPSKTADIEQTLVVGAHGPLSMHVVIQ